MRGTFLCWDVKDFDWFSLNIINDNNNREKRCVRQVNIK